MVRFEALKDFTSPETQSSYLTGLSYVALDPGLFTDAASKDRAEALLRMIPEWLADGKITLSKPSSARMEGAGQVSGGSS